MDFHAGFRETGAVELGAYCLGSVLCAVVIKGILITQEFLAAGFTGVALIIHYFVHFLTSGGALLCAQYTPLCP